VAGRPGPGSHWSAAFPPSSATIGTSRGVTQPWRHRSPWAGSAGIACIAARATIVAPVPPFRSLAVRYASLRVQQVQATCGQFVVELGVGGPTSRTWARARRGQRWASVGLHVAAPSQGEGRPRDGFWGSIPALGKHRGWPGFPLASSPLPTSQGAIQRAPGGLGSGKQSELTPSRDPYPLVGGSLPEPATNNYGAAHRGEPASPARLREGADPGAAAPPSGSAPRAAPSFRARLRGGSVPGSAANPSVAALWGEPSSPPSSSFYPPPPPPPHPPLRDQTPRPLDCPQVRR